MNDNSEHLEALKEASPLGKQSDYNSDYQPGLLFAIPRLNKRLEIGIKGDLPFSGVDIWNAYEVSWLNLRGKPQVAVAIITVPCDSEMIFESKSLKLYFNSLNSTQFRDKKVVEEIIQQDLSKVTKSHVQVKLQSFDDSELLHIEQFPGKNLDDIDVEISDYHPNSQYLKTLDVEVEETVYSHLLKSNCLVTHQPDWASISISYQGKQIDHAGLLKYLISFRNHNEFHEQCVERIFMQILENCQPQQLTVYARYTRRGGIDINPFRSNVNHSQVNNCRLIRQ